MDRRLKSLNAQIIRLEARLREVRAKRGVIQEELNRDKRDWAEETILESRAQVVRWRKGGMTFREIGKQRRVSPGRARDIYEQGIIACASLHKKIVRASVLAFCKLAEGISAKSGKIV